MTAAQIHYSGPLHEQVHNVLRSRIQSGEWKPLDLLPGELNLSRELGVSVGTVRKAMDQLARENIVVRERGRGTYVKDGAEWRSNSVFRLAGRDGKPLAPRITVVDHGMTIATPREAGALRLAGRMSMATRVLKLSREWKEAGRLLCRETIMVEEPRFPDLLRTIQPSAENLFSTYDEVYRAKVDRLSWEIGSSILRDERTGCHELMSGDPTLLISRVALDVRAIPIEVCEQLVYLANCRVQISR
ncbi:MAG: GntR family transcriptional regulator [Hyphomicrobiaceae bacterium]